MREEHWFCDMEDCKNKIHEEKNLGRKIQVIFLTEQTEGRATKPYLHEAKIDMCNDCYEKLLKGNMIYGSGAQGHNRYTFERPWEEKE